MNKRLFAFYIFLSLFSNSVEAGVSKYHVQKRIVGNNIEREWNFGASVEISEKELIVGAYKSKTTGSVYFFDFDGEQLAEVVSPRKSERNNFGSSIAANDKYLLVGDYTDSQNGKYSGAAFLYDLKNKELVKEFQYPDKKDYDWFGHTVAISEKYAVVGAKAGRGKEYICVFDIESGELFRLIMAPSKSFIGQDFGYSLDVKGNHLLVGARNDDAGVKDSGAAYLYEITSGNLLQTFVISDGKKRDYFGHSVALTDKLVAVGAIGHKEIGSVFVFSRDSGKELFRLTPDDGMPRDDFGWSLDIDESRDLVVVGSFSNGDPQEGSGAVYVFDVKGKERAKIIMRKDPKLKNAHFGCSTKIRNGKILVGAYLESSENFFGGASYLFDLTKKK